MKRKEFKRLLKAIIRQEMNAAEELIQECDNPEAADRCLARAEAFEEALDYINQ